MGAGGSRTKSYGASFEVDTATKYPILLQKTSPLKDVPLPIPMETNVGKQTGGKERKEEYKKKLDTEIKKASNNQKNEKNTNSSYQKSNAFMFLSS